MAHSEWAGDDERQGMPNPTLSRIHTLEKKSCVSVYTRAALLALFQSFIHDCAAARTQQLY
jgi:hypothetical protein